MNIQDISTKLVHDGLNQMLIRMTVISLVHHLNHDFTGINLFTSLQMDDILNISQNWYKPFVSLTLRMKGSSGWSLSSRALCRTSCSKSQSVRLCTSTPGNRSLTRPRNTGTSSVTILGMLKSRRARINTCSCRRTMCQCTGQVYDQNRIYFIFLFLIIKSATFL